jgi:hypothetical protein
MGFQRLSTWVLSFEVLKSNYDFFQGFNSSVWFLGFSVLFNFGGAQF